MQPSILPLLWPRCGAALSSSQGFDRVSESMTARTRETDGETGRAPLHSRLLPTGGGRTDFRAPWVASGYVQVCLNRFNGGGSTRPGTVKRPACPMVSQRLKGGHSRPYAERIGVHSSSSVIDHGVGAEASSRRCDLTDRYSIFWNGHRRR